jgi:hypothetical protein
MNHQQYLRFRTTGFPPFISPDYKSDIELVSRNRVASPYERRKTRRVLYSCDSRSKKPKYRTGRASHPMHRKNSLVRYESKHPFLSSQQGVSSPEECRRYERSFTPNPKQSVISMRRRSSNPIQLLSRPQASTQDPNKIYTSSDVRSQFSV